MGGSSPWTRPSAPGCGIQGEDQGNLAPGFIDWVTGRCVRAQRKVFALPSSNVAARDVGNEKVLRGAGGPVERSAELLQVDHGKIQIKRSGHQIFMPETKELKQGYWPR